MARVRKINKEEFYDVYRNHIKRDFPPEEIKPFWVVKKSYQHHRYSAYIYEDKEQMKGYASFFWQNEDILLLDYFAVSEMDRGCGIGSAFLKELTKILSELSVKGILFECEIPDNAKNEQERHIRKRRINFYEKNGVILTDTIVKVFGVKYCMMYLPVNASIHSINVGNELLNIYHNTSPKLLSRYAVKIIQK